MSIPYGIGHALLLRKAERTYQRADDGKFGSGPGTPKKTTKPKAKPKKETPEQKAQANQAKTAEAIGLEPAAMTGLASFAAGGDLDPAQAKALFDAGLVSTNADGSYRATPAGRAVLAAAKAGDVGKARDALASGKDNAARAVATKEKAQALADEKAAKEKAKAEKEAKPKGGGGGGGSKDDKLTTEQANKNRAAVAEATGLGTELDGAMARLEAGMGGANDEAKAGKLVGLGLATKSPSGKYTLSPEGKAYYAAAEKGDQKGAQAAMRNAEVKAAKNFPAAKPSTKVKKVAQDTVLAKAFMGFAPLEPWQSDNPQAEQLVMGVASSNLPDHQGGIWKGQRYAADIIDAEAMAEALLEYPGTICEMHDENTNAGQALDVRIEGGKTYLIAKIGDQSAWAKCSDGIYKGFSIGGKCLEAHLEQVGKLLMRRVTKLTLKEISLVDTPAHPEAEILMMKRGDPMDDQEVAEGSDDLAALANLNKAAPDPNKVVMMIQALRNEAELAGNLEGAEQYTQAIGLLMIGSGGAEAEADEADDLAMSADMDEVDAEVDEAEDEATLAMRSKVKKAGAKISRERMALLKSALMSYAKALAGAGDEDSIKMLKALTPAEPAAEADPEALGKMLNQLFEPKFQALAKGLMVLYEKTEAIASQPVAGGPAKNLAAIRKSLGPAQVPASSPSQQPEAQPDYVAHLRRMVAIESNPTTLRHYQEDLARLTAGQ